MTTDVSAARTARGRRKGAVTVSLSHEACYIPTASAARRRRPVEARRGGHRKEMLEAQGLSKSFYGTPAVTDVSFRVESGEILGFLGPNGAGKTTTMRMITGFLDADRRPGDARGRGRHGKTAAGQAGARIPARDARALSGDAGPGVRRLPRRAVRSARARREGIRRRGAREVLRGRRRVEPDRQPVEGISTAGRPRGSARPQAEGARPRRAHGRARPAADREGARADPRPEKGPHDPAFDPHPPRSRARLRPDPHHRQGTSSWLRGRPRRFATRCRRCRA